MTIRDGSVPLDAGRGGSGLGDGGLEGTVLVREDLGSEVVLQIQTAAGRLAVRRPARDTTVPGTAVRVEVVAVDHVHHFAADGRRIERP
ncbi:MAG TPA: TOBE domain-containing protein [Euzebya sp.]|nr:TOBE domain-containing protein [Euzebya sp.]